MLTTHKAHHHLTFPDFTRVLSAWGMAIITASFLMLVAGWAMDGTFRIDPVFFGGLVFLALVAALIRLFREE